jgi:hypothetical protein
MRNRFRRLAHRGLWALLVGFTTLGVSVSAQNRRVVAHTITVYAEPNFRGESATFRNDTPDLQSYSLNDKISSLDIPNGEAWEVCQDINFGNRCQVYSTSIADLRADGWNDRISSIRYVGRDVARGRGAVNNRGVFGRRDDVFGRGDDAIVFYDKPNFRGKSTTVTTASGRTGFNARNGSLEVRGGPWELCDRSGRCVTVDRDVPNTARLGLARVESVRLVNNYSNRNTQRRP